MLRFTNARTYLSCKTEQFHGGLRPYGAPSRFSSSHHAPPRGVIPLNPAGGRRRPPAHPFGVRPMHPGCVTKGRTQDRLMNGRGRRVGDDAAFGRREMGIRDD